MRELWLNGVIVIASRTEIREGEKQFREDLMARVPNRTIRESEPDIAERNFRKPKHVIGNVFVRPFWRDRREAPLLPLSERADPYTTSHY